MSKLQIAFKAQIKKIEPYTLASGDKQIKLTLQLNDDNTGPDIIDGITALWSKCTPEVVMVMMMENDGE